MGLDEINFLSKIVYIVTTVVFVFFAGLLLCDASGIPVLSSAPTAFMGK